MADKDGLKIAKDYHVNEAFANQGGFYVKGANNLDWGMKNAPEQTSSTPRAATP